MQSKSHGKSVLDDIIDKRYIVYQMSRRDFSGRYASSFLGIFWAFLQPLAMMLILWLVFSYGLKAGSPVEGVGFAPWFFTAMIAWNFFQDALTMSTGALTEYSFLVKKIKFTIEILPIVKIISSVVLHAIFLLILVGILLLSGVKPSWYWLQVFYYIFCSLFLLTGVSFITSALNTFGRDIAQLVGIVMQFGFWATPIVWNYQNIPEHLHIFIKLNPVFYIVEGYRKSFLYEEAFWSADLYQTIYFWAVSLAFLLIGFRTFKKFKPHFADVI